MNKEVGNTIEEKNATDLFECTVKALYRSTTTRVYCLYKKKGYLLILSVSINMV